MTKIAFPTDEHFPFQDDSARSVALQIVRDFEPDVRICGSDGLDFYSISRFDKNPERAKVGLQVEIDAWKAGQREWRDAAPNAGAFFIVGNHEDRLRRYIWQHPELSDLEVFRLPSILGFAELGIFWEKDKGDLLANRELNVHGRLLIKHGEVVRKNSAYTAKAELEREFYAISLLTAHTHRGGSYYVNTRNGVVQAHECFCLCDLHPEYVQNPDWQQGIVLATASPEGVSIEPIPFYRAQDKVKAIWRGKQYTEE